MSRKKNKIIAVKPLNPPATEAEKNEASRVWTAAMDVMQARGFGRHLWGNTSGAAQDFVILMLRASRGENGMPPTKAEERCQAVTGNREGQVPTSAAVYDKPEPRPEAAPGGDDGYAHEWQITVRADNLRGAMDAVWDCWQAWRDGHEPKGGSCPAAMGDRMDYRVKKSV